MRGLQKTKRVSWAADGNLCQVKLFSSDDGPSKVGMGTKINLQPKRKSAILHTKGSMGVPDIGLPLGFKGVRPQTQLWKNKLARIPLAKWTRPPTFVLSPSLRVAAGEESEEVQTQNQRELRVLEAVYPRPSATPPNPVVSSEVGNAGIDDSRTPLVPLTPIEEEAAGGEAPLDKVALPSSQVAPALVRNPLENGRSADCAQPQLLVDTSAALSALMNTANWHENLIDHELLMKILTNPATLEQLINGKGNPSPPQNAPPLSQPSLAAPIQSAAINPICNPSIPSSTVPSKDLSYPYQHPSPPITAFASAAQPTVPSNVAVAAPPVKDMNYYKSLIQQHGEEKQQEAIHPQFSSHHVGFNPNLASVGNSKQTRESKHKFTKSCVYFNSLKGCRNGANCTYQHDPSLRKRASSIIEMQSAKRIKVDTVMRGSQMLQFTSHV